KTLEEELEASSGVRVERIAADLSQREAPAALEAAVGELGIELEALVNNAGLGTYGPFVDNDLEEEMMEIDVNVRALTELTKRFLPGMVRRGRGRILNVASTAAFQPGPGMAVYFATKAYVLSLSEAVAYELRGTGVTVTALCPGGTSSEFHARADMEHSRFVRPEKWPTSEEVARYGYRAMMRGIPVAIHGTANRVGAWSVRLFPRRWVTALTAKVMS
ncbi:MAG TPA: SDR family oxidoreductase, partial [Acidobacteria bacterium]|nr:SDR family oxidoreductase [Acidobacteriota bacterium]